MQKSDLRTLFLEKRQALSPAELHFLSQKIADVFFESVSLDSVRFLHCFFPIARFHEIDSSIILRRLWANHQAIQTVVPRITSGKGNMESVIVTPETELIQNRWGIDEPADSTVVENDLIDVVVVPLLAFDRRGHRVGYGRGFYDRFLKTCRCDCLKVGLSLFPPIDLIENTSDHDIVLDSVIAPDQVYETITQPLTK